MKGWFKFNDKDSAWNNLLNSTGQNIIYNQIFWINLKIEEGWSVDKLYFKNEKNEITTVLVIFIKKYFSFNYLWSSGGFSQTNIKHLEPTLDLFKSYITKNYKNFYFRMNSVDLFSAEINYMYTKHFYQPMFFISSGFTVVNDLSYSIDTILQKLHSKRRYTVKSALKQDIKWDISFSKNVIENVKIVFNKFSKETKRNFKIPTSFEIDYLSKHENHFIFIVGSLNNIPITTAIINVTNKTPLYLYAATIEEGRKVGASYAMICHLQSYLYNKGYRYFDLLGISPKDKDIAGIDKFKLTFLGNICKYNGEWEYGNYINRFLGNIIIKLKG